MWMGWSLHQFSESLEVQVPESYFKSHISLYSLGEGLRLKCNSLHKLWFHRELTRHHGEEETGLHSPDQLSGWKQITSLGFLTCFCTKKMLSLCDLLTLWITEQSRKSCWWQQTQSTILKKGQFQFSGTPFRKGGLQF